LEVRVSVFRFSTFPNLSPNLFISVKTEKLLYHIYVVIYVGVYVHPGRMDGGEKEG